MKVHEENKLMALLLLDYTEEQAERIVACITSIYTDESDLEELVYKIDNNLEDWIMLFAIIIFIGLSANVLKELTKWVYLEWL